MNLDFWEWAIALDFLFEAMAKFPDGPAMLIASRALAVLFLR
jgi:hypothetical protein